MALKFIDVTFNNIKYSIENYLKSEHNKGNILFSVASPYGQILSVLENLHQLSFLYLKNSIQQYDVLDPTNTNRRAIKTAAILSGHNIGRAISATGTLRFSLKSNIDLDKEIPGGRIKFNNRTRIKNRTNGLDYCFNLGVETQTHIINSGYSFLVPIMQGKWNVFNATGTGESLLTFSLDNPPEGGEIENFNVQVQVNGELWSVKKHLYDLLPDEKACVVKTGLKGGIDVIFGNGGFGAIPGLSQRITVSFLVTDGSPGNIFRRTRDDFDIVDDVIDGNGDTLDLTKAFNIDIYTDINFGADGEPISFTKSILPIASNNFVLALPQQYAYEIKKLGVFSHVNAYEKTGTVFIVATPNIKLFKNPDSNYFTIDTKAFELDNYEKSKIDAYLRTSGNIQLTKKYRITSPKLSYYVMNVFVVIYSDATEDSVKAQIMDRVSEYFLNLSRYDRIPKLDLIKALSSIRDLHSADVQFISRTNEEYHAKAMQDAKNKYNKFNSKFETDISITKTNPDYVPSESKGLDPFLGDIVFDPSEIPVIRGGWSDRNGTFYRNDMTGGGLQSINIIRKGTVDSKNKM